MSSLLLLVQARSSSTRLPGKVLMPFDGERCILQIQLERLRQVLPEARLLVATTNNPADDRLAELVVQWGFKVFRGDENDVLQRFIDAARAEEAEHILRICSDNPFLLSSGLVQLATKGLNSSADYLSFQHADGTPAIRMHWGLYAEYVSLNALHRAAEATDDPFYHEHVTNYLYGHPELFDVQWLKADAPLLERPALRLTIDDEQDFALAQSLFEKSPAGELLPLIRAIDEFPEAQSLMRQQIRKYSK